MKSILCVLLSLALLLSGCAFAETTASEAATLTIDELTVSVNGTDYELPASGTIGLVCSDDTMLMDIGVDYNSETLFPMQVKFAEDGVYLLIGNSSTAYVFDAALLDDADLSYSEMLSTLFESFDSAPNSESLNLEAAIAAEEAACAKYFNAEAEETTYEDQPATHRAGTLDNDQFCSMIEEILNAISPDLASEAVRFLNYSGKLSSLVESTTADADDAETEEMPETLAEYLAKTGLEVSCDYDIVAAESGAGTTNLTIHLLETATGETINLPFTIVQDGEGNTTYECICKETDDLGDYTVTMSGAESASATETNFAVELPDASFTMSLGVTVNEDASASIHSDISMNSEDLKFGLNLEETISDSGEIDAAFSASYEDVLDVLGLGCRFRLTNGASFEDRISGTNEKRFATEEELTNGSTSLVLRLTSLMGDLETLLNDPAFAELGEAFNQLGQDDSENYYSGTSTSEEDVAFELPEFTDLPEGYEQVFADYYTYGKDGLPYSQVTLAFDMPYDFIEANSQDAYMYAPIDVSIVGPENSIEAYSRDENGELTEAEIYSIDAPLIYTYGDCYAITFVRDNVSYNITVYNDVIPLEEVPDFLDGIVWGGSANVVAGSAA